MIQENVTRLKTVESVTKKQTYLGSLQRVGNRFAFRNYTAITFKSKALDWRLRVARSISGPVGAADIFSAS